MGTHITKLQYCNLYIGDKYDMSQFHIQDNIQPLKPFSNHKILQRIFHLKSIDRFKSISLHTSTVMFLNYAITCATHKTMTSKQINQLSYWRLCKGHARPQINVRAGISNWKYQPQISAYTQCQTSRIAIVKRGGAATCGSSRCNFDFAMRKGFTIFAPNTYYK